jgi:hypothetical protein
MRRTITSKQKTLFGLITNPKRELIASETDTAFNIQEVVVADLPEATTTSKRPRQPT